MHRSTLPRRARTAEPGWSHPYLGGLFSPVFYADGDDDQDDGDQDDQEGADGDDDEGQADDDTDDGKDGDDDADPDGADDLGDKGKRALDSMKAKLKAERTRRRTAEAQLQDKPDGDADQIQAKADAAATARANTRILRSELKAAATGKLINPKDALVHIDLEQFEVDEDGQVDEDDIADAIEDLLKERPYLAAATAKRFQGTGDGGAARKAGRPKQLTKNDLKTMSADQIVAAQDAGKLDDYLGAS